MMLKNVIEEIDENKILKRSALLNSVAGLISSVFVSLLTMVITRSGDLATAGVFSIASVIAYQCLTIGSFATYNVQASDLKQEFHLNDFAGLRVISVMAMILLLLWYSFCSGYDMDKAMVVFSFGLFKLSDVVDDIFRAEYHRQQRLDIASVILLIRYVAALLLFAGLYIISRNLVLTSLISGAFVMGLTLLMHGKCVVHFVKERIHPRFSKLKSLIMVLLPLCAASYIRLYICNLPKYAIDASLSSEIQMYYGILIMPAMMINLLSEIVFAPFIPCLANSWYESMKDFRKLIARQLMIIGGISLITMLGGYIIGLDLLSWFYGVDLKLYMGSLLVLLAAGGCNAASIFMTLVLTIQRKQNWMIAAYVLIMFIAGFVCDPVVLRYGIEGATVLYFAICLSNFVFFLLISWVGTWKQGGNLR